MANKYQLLSFVLLVLTIHGCINFAAGQFGNPRFPNRPPAGKCKERCEANEEQSELSTEILCGSGFTYCFKPNSSYWEDLKDAFTIEDIPRNECLVRGNVSGGPTERLALSQCRQDCEPDEKEIKGSTAVCRSGYICCKEADDSFWSSLLTSMWRGFLSIWEEGTIMG